MATTLSKQFVLGLALVAFVSGCTGTQFARLPGDIDGGGYGDEHFREIAVGDNAHVVLKSGELVDGEVIRLSRGSVTLGQAGNFGYVETEVRAIDILSVERVTSGYVWTVVAVVGLGLVAVLVKSFSEWELN